MLDDHWEPPPNTIPEIWDTAQSDLDRIEKEASSYREVLEMVVTGLDSHISETSMCLHDMDVWGSRLMTHKPDIETAVAVSDVERNCAAIQNCLAVAANFRTSLQRILAHSEKIGKRHMCRAWLASWRFERRMRQVPYPATVPDDSTV